FPDLGAHVLARRTAFPQQAVATEPLVDDACGQALGPHLLARRDRPGRRRVALGQADRRAADAAQETVEILVSGKDEMEIVQAYHGLQRVAARQAAVATRAVGSPAVDDAPGQVDVDLYRRAAAHAQGQQL